MKMLRPGDWQHRKALALQVPWKFLGLPLFPTPTQSTFPFFLLLATHAELAGDPGGGRWCFVMSHVGLHCGEGVGVMPDLEISG